MGTAREFTAEKLVMGVLLSLPELKSAVLQRLAQAFGPPDWVSPELPFAYTHYYDAQMGTPIVRFFVSCRDPVDPGRLAAAKLATNALEEEFRQPGLRAGLPQGSAAGLRPLNLDPGLLSLARFVLASTKPSAHRVPLSDGIYAEIELLYERGRFRPVEWTYPDYCSEEYRGILEHIRELFKAQRSA
jgi:hypothetical protein